MAKNRAAVSLGRLGGAKKSDRKALSSRENGKKGGRPKMLHGEPCPRCQSTDVTYPRNYGRPQTDRRWCMACGSLWTPP